MDKGNSSADLFEGLEIANDLTFFRMNPKAYEHCWIDNERIDMPGNVDELYVSLSKCFPAETKGLKKYLKLVQQVSSQLFLIPEMNGFGTMLPSHIVPRN